MFVGGAFAADRRFVSFSAAVSWWLRVALRPVMITGSSAGLSSRPTKPRSARAPRPASRRCSVILLWRAVVISLDRPGLAAEIQIRLPFSSVSARNSRPWALCLPESLPVVLPGAAVGADQGAVEEDHDPAEAGDLLQRPVQALGPGGQQLHDFLPPAADGGLPDPVAAGRVGQTLVVAQNGEHGDGHPAGFGLAPGRAHLVPAPAYQVGDEADGPLRQREADLVDNFLSVLGGLVFGHTSTNSRRGPSRYGRNRPVRPSAPLVSVVGSGPMRCGQASHGRRVCAAGPGPARSSPGSSPGPARGRRPWPSPDRPPPPRSP